MKKKMKMNSSKALVTVDWILISLLMVVIFGFIVPDYLNMRDRLALLICSNNKIIYETNVTEYLKKYPYLHHTKLDPKLLTEVGYLEELPVCPRNGKYEILIGNGGSFEVRCSEHDR